MRVFVFIIILLLSEKHFAGCTGPRLHTDNGVNFMYNFWGSDTVNVNPSDSFAIFVNGGTCYDLRKTTIFFNGNIIHNCTDPHCYFKWKSNPGHYEIQSKNLRYDTGNWTIDLLAKPGATDTLTNHVTSIFQIQDPNPNFLLYPNPATHLITISNESESIKNIEVVNSTSNTFNSYQVNTSKIILDLLNYPPGIYFFYVSTLADKVIIRKVIVLSP